MTTTDGPIDSVSYATRAALDAAYDRLMFQYRQLEHERGQIESRSSHWEYDPTWISNGEVMNALWLGMGAIHHLCLQQDAEWTPPPWEDGDPDPF